MDILNNLAICLLPVEVGPCEGQYHQMRWHFDEERRNCISFIYSGCGGNHNNFKSYQNCMDFCRTELGQPGPRKGAVICQIVVARLFNFALHITAPHIILYIRLLGYCCIILFHLLYCLIIVHSCFITYNIKQTILVFQRTKST